MKRITPEQVVTAFAPGDFALQPSCFILFPEDGRPLCGCAVGALEYRRLGAARAKRDLDSGMLGRFARARGLTLAYAGGFSEGFSFPFDGCSDDDPDFEEGFADGKAARAAVVAAFELPAGLMQRNPQSFVRLDALPAPEGTDAP